MLYLIVSMQLYRSGSILHGEGSLRCWWGIDGDSMLDGFKFRLYSHIPLHRIEYWALGVLLVTHRDLAELIALSWRCRYGECIPLAHGVRPGYKVSATIGYVNRAMGWSPYRYSIFGKCTFRAEYPHNMHISSHSVLLQTLNVHPIYREGLQGIPWVYNPLYPQHIALINSGSRRQIILSVGHIAHVHRPARCLVGEGVGTRCIKRL